LAVSSWYSKIKTRSDAGFLHRIYLFEINKFGTVNYNIFNMD